MSIIVLFGHKSSGKDTTAEIIESLVQDKAVFKEAFAKRVKQMVSIAFPKIKQEDLYGPSERREKLYQTYPFAKNCVLCGNTSEWEDIGGKQICKSCDFSYPPYLTPRILCQTLGTNWGRALYTNVWVDALFDDVELNVLSEREDRLVIVLDGRFPNELKGAKDRKALTIRLLRDPYKGSHLHGSETELDAIPLDQFDYVIPDFDTEDWRLHLTNLIRALLLREGIMDHV